MEMKMRIAPLAIIAVTATAVFAAGTSAIIAQPRAAIAAPPLRALSERDMQAAHGTGWQLTFDPRSGEGDRSAQPSGGGAHASSRRDQAGKARTPAARDDEPARSSALAALSDGRRLKFSHAISDRRDALSISPASSGG